MENSLARAVEAADSVWAVLAISIIGLYVLIWRFGDRILRMVTSNSEKVDEAHAKVDLIEQGLSTEDGDLGAAMDKLTQALQDHMVVSAKYQQTTAEQIRQLRRDFNLQAVANMAHQRAVEGELGSHGGLLRKHGELLREHGERISALEMTKEG